jgi:broad specificity phosphatase PhoE
LYTVSKTAEIVAEHAGHDPSFVTERVELRECGLGDFEGMLKQEIHGPKYEHIFDGFAALDHDQRLDATYFPGVTETPRQMAERVAALMAHVANGLLGGINTETGGVLSDNAAPSLEVLFVTHSTIIESVLSTWFSKYYEGISMDRCAFFKVHLPVVPDVGKGTTTSESVASLVQLGELSGIRFSGGLSMK